MERQLQFSTYFDSNVREDLVSPSPSAGLTLRGRLSSRWQRPSLEFSADLLGQSVVDATIPTESKLLIDAGIGASYSITGALRVSGQVNHFQKALYVGTGSYAWTDLESIVRFTPTPRFGLRLGYRYRRKTLAATQRLRFGEDNLELKGRYNLNSQSFIESGITGSNVIHRDFSALVAAGDSLLVPLAAPQEDRGLEGWLHVRRGGRTIVGLQFGFGEVRSNSVIGGYTKISARAYLSGQLRRTTFYHIDIRLIHKAYAFPNVVGESRYRDPEEPLQNMAHIRLERALNVRSIGYIQVSRLQNETSFNQRYYDKTMVEVGVKLGL
ncbi:MAG: hypothetical protein V3U35_05205 [Candidatus Neomarinimicrobiota bacterium]